MSNDPEQIPWFWAPDDVFFVSCSSVGFYTILVERFYTVRRGGGKEKGRKRKEKGKREKKKRKKERSVRQPGLQFGSFLKILSQDSCPITKGRKGYPDDRNCPMTGIYIYFSPFLVTGIFGNERGG
jgi:hypothetical protein